MRRVIHRVFGVIERMNVQVDFDPFLGLTRACASAHARARNLAVNRKDFILLVNTARMGRWLSNFDYEHG